MPNVLPQVNQVKRTVTPKVNKVGRPIAKAGPVTRRNAALRANKEVIDRTQKLKRDFDTKYGKIKQLAQRFNQYKDAAMTGAEAGRLDDLKGQFDAAAREYAGAQSNDAAQKAASLGLGDISSQMDTIDQYASVRDLSTQPFSPDPSGGLTLSGGPVMIFTDPDLPGGIMTQLGTDLVAIGTGGQGEPLVQVGSRCDVGYPLITNVLPVPEASTAAVEGTSDQALVINPATTGATINFAVDQTPYSLAAGLALPLIGQPSWVIAFDRGGQIGEARYTLAPGGYSFTVKTSGWDLVQKTFKVTLDNSANSDDFNYVLENQAGVVPACQVKEITSNLPIVLTFDRGDGREAAHKELAEGTYATGIDPRTRLLELFPGTEANAPLTSIANRTAAVPAPTMAPTTVLASSVSSEPTSTAAVSTPPSPSTPVLP